MMIYVEQNQDTALHIAAALKRHKIGKLLVEAGINVALKNKVSLLVDVCAWFIYFSVLCVSSFDSVECDLKALLCPWFTKQVARLIVKSPSPARLVLMH